MTKISQRWRDDHRHTRICGRREGMTNRYLLGAGVALAVAFGGAQAHAQLTLMPPPGTPGAFYIGPEGGWTSLSSQTDTTSGQIVRGTGGAALAVASRSATANF